jgi:hypothetical protein
MGKIGLAVALTPLLGSLIACAAPSARVEAVPASSPPVAPATPAVAHFLHDDLPGARALAARSNLPLFVEVEAPW